MRRDLAGVRTIGVTGTKGKTSTTEFIAQLMEASGLRTAVSTTESARIGTRYLEPANTSATSPRSCAAAGGRHGVPRGGAVLVRLRWDAQQGLDLDAAVLTNIGTDHIVDHGNVRNYVAIKRRLFRDLAPGPPAPGPWRS